MIGRPSARNSSDTLGGKAAPPLTDRRDAPAQLVHHLAGNQLLEHRPQQQLRRPCGAALADQSQRHGWAVWAAMAILFLCGVTTAYWAEPEAILCCTESTNTSPPRSRAALEGKEVRFGIANSALFATVTTDASCGAITEWHDSFTPLGGMVPLVNIMLSETVFGGVGAGLYGILIYVVLSVFIAGLMVGRTPEYLGKKIEAYDVKMAMLVTLVFPLIILVLTGISSVEGFGTSSITNPGPHGFTQILYSFTSQAGNNGSAFAGLNGNTLWYNTAGAMTMLVGRFFMIIPMLAIAGNLAKKKTVPAWQVRSR